MKYIIIFALTVYADFCAAVVIWPNTVAPCNTTLQACISDSPTGETIEIRSNDAIEDVIVLPDAKSLVAGTGYKPLFTNSSALLVNDSSTTDVVITVSGMDFTGAYISYRGSTDTSSSTTLNITNNYMTVSTANDSSLFVVNTYGRDVNLNIAFNRIQHTFELVPNDIQKPGAIAILNGTDNPLIPGSGHMTGRIYNNQIDVDGAGSVGIGIYEFSANTSNLDVSSNVITGGESAAVYIEKIAGSTGSSDFDFAHNAMYSNQIDSDYSGLVTEVSSGELEINAINNTVIGAYDGFSFQESGSGVLKSMRMVY